MRPGTSLKQQFNLTQQCWISNNLFISASQTCSTAVLEPYRSAALNADERYLTKPPNYMAGDIKNSAGTGLRSFVSAQRWSIIHLPFWIDSQNTQDQYRHNVTNILSARHLQNAGRQRTKNVTAIKSKKSTVKGMTRIIFCTSCEERSHGH